MSEEVYELNPPPTAGIFDSARNAISPGRALSVSSGGRMTARERYQGGIRNVSPYITAAAPSPSAA